MPMTKEEKREYNRRYYAEHLERLRELGRERARSRRDPSYNQDWRTRLGVRVPFTKEERKERQYAAARRKYADSAEVREQVRKYNVQWRLQNADYIRERKREYYIKNKNEIRERYQRWLTENLERKRQKDKLYASQNREHRRETLKQWRKANLKHLREYHREYGPKYREKNRERMKEYFREYHKRYAAKYRDDRSKRERRRRALMKATVEFLKARGLWEAGTKETYYLRRSAALAYVRQAGLLEPGHEP